MTHSVRLGPVEVGWYWGPFIDIRWPNRDGDADFQAYVPWKSLLVILRPYPSMWLLGVEEDDMCGGCTRYGLGPIEAQIGRHG
jgi:hypothetical protein